MKLSSTKYGVPAQRSNGASRASTTAQEGGARGAAARDACLEVELLRPAQDVLRELPDFDAARVAALRAALQEGRLPFDAGKLAGLIQRFHGAKE
ncbi:flagellar biosynthesis anti-sigma factor FlgM [Burkholderia thailandensis]|uniref:flagellar biosynthesis anti-sigma factor FlgM n=1 Tax=Burkholderia thailandensis TaxID=57975 RepID=UPI00016A45F2|nr:flagellar biosynthesis anti-sigma factor FlgM [Burkholderia thailandensis]AHI68099.1 flagellar biosynthesis anti-sigma factor FlgM [Burkholderia thailandensis H0587]AIP66693.1 hypothetical protein DR62_5094 [Burkholderia thailandensis]AOI53859.1 flagellar biosynthesis anti-sigma factor FlgM [Burkholderia thailandensis]AOJ52842.1 flagellar biosynthesis anti-sigma factor FlgM [Burkholderia thailandensis]AVR29051.1 flagellar biosynthesis anti-sigma factor FlgM [Burkholderia thailandensis]